MSDKDYEEGYAACDAYYKSQAYSSLTRYVRAQDAIRLFLPGVKESMSQVSSPLPRPRQDWIKGFSDRQQEIGFN